MAAAIGAFTMAAVRGRMKRTPIAYRLITRDQVNGVGVLIGNWHALASRLETKAYAANSGAAVALAEAYRGVLKAFATAGSLITVVEGTGETWTNVAPLEADAKVDACVSPAGPFVVSCTWLLLPDTVVPP